MISKNTKNYNYIILNDKYLFENVIMPVNATNYLIFYKKTDPNYWGLTIKCIPPHQSPIENQYIWKATWLNNNDKNCLEPTEESKCLNISSIPNDLYLKLKTILQDNLAKKKKKNIE